MKVHKIFLSIAFLFFVTLSSAQSGRIIGSVYGNGEPLVYVSVLINSISKSTFSDTSGRFVFENLPDGNYELSISRVGFSEQKKVVKIMNNGLIELVVNLVQSSINMKAITIGANKVFEGNIYSKLDLQLRLVSSSQDLLRLVPGLFIAQYTDGDKAVVNFNYNDRMIGISVENIFNINWKEAQFAALRRLRKESVSVNEICFTPGTPLLVNISFGYNF